jgi:hypothetical protein
VAMKKFNTSGLQEENDCALEAMCLEYLEICPVLLPEKRKSAMPQCLRITKKITKKKSSRGKLKSSIDFTQEQKSLEISEIDLIFL